MYFLMFFIFFSLFLLLGMFGFWVYKKSLVCESNDVVMIESFKKMFLMYNKLVFVCCVIFFVLSFVLLLLSCFYLYVNGWDCNKLMNFLDFLFVVFFWGVIFFYLFSNG